MLLKKARKLLDSMESEKSYIEKEIKSLKQKSKGYQSTIMSQEKALHFIKLVAIETQKELEYNINDMVGAGLNSVFNQPYEFHTHFEIRRDRPECDMFFKKGKRLVDPLAFSGLGAADVGAFSLRGASLSIANRYRGVLLLDEPFKHLKGEEENKRVIHLMRRIAKKLQIQIICVNDERAAREDIIDGADRVFYVEQKGIKSQVVVL